MGRHLHVGFVDDVISTWDEGAARKFVKKLGLKLVEASQYGKDVWKPSLVCFQGLGVDHVYDDYWRPLSMDWADLTGVSKDRSVGGNR